MRDAVIELYKKFDGEKVVGIYDNNTPAWFLRDPELIKRITVKEFDHFVNHKVTKSTNDNLFGLSVFAMADQKWKDMRSTLSPAFTGSKMRLMFDLIKEVSEQGVEYLKKREARDSEIIMEMKDFFNRFMNDAIATTAFGIRTNSLEDENNKFFKMGKAVINFTFFKLQFLFFFNFKVISKFLNMRLLNKKYDDYFKTLVIDNMKYRKENKIVRNDVINILMDAKGMSLTENGAKPIREWTDEEIVAQCFVFFFGGLDTVSQGLTFTTYELMANPDCQKKLMKEIEETTKILNGQPLNYETMSKMKYMDAVVNEVLRLWGGAPTLDRVCSRDFVVEDNENGNILIQQGDIVFIPVSGIHTDSQYYADPNKFDPSRFYENDSPVNETTYLPFGAGPRKCIANRFALMEIKTVLFYLLGSYSIRLCSKSHVPLELKPGMQLQSKHGFWVKMVPTNTEDHKKWINS
ncbi:hypothetical protein ACFFRR_005905 [Megaselia abdita]